MAKPRNGERFAQLEAIAKSLNLTVKTNGQVFDKPLDVAVILYHRKVRVQQPPKAKAVASTHETEVLRKAGLI